MATSGHYSKIAALVIGCVLIVLPTGAWSSPLPLHKVLTVRLSTLSTDGKLTQVSEVSAKTDSSCKLSFNFPDVPSSVDTPFLHIQIMDGTSVLRQSIVPSPEPNGNVDIGVSEVTNLQAIAILKSAAISGRLTPLHLFVAQTVIRTPAISPADADSAGAAVSAGADALNNVILTEGISSERMTVFLNSVMKGLRASAALYRKGVDDSIQFDPKVEAYNRGEAFAVLLISFMSAGVDAAIPLETIYTSVAAAGAVVEANLAGTPGYNTTTKDLIRLCLVNAVVQLGNYRTAIDHLKGFSFTGIATPKFSHIFDMIYFLQDQTTYNQRGFDGYWLAGQPISTNPTIYQAEFNIFANRDLLMMKVSMETVFDGSKDLNGDYSSLMMSIVGRMSNMGGSMTGMTPEKLLGILGKPIITFPVFKPTLGAKLVSAQAAIIPTLNAFELAAWSFVDQTLTFRYTPITGLIDLLVNKPTVIPSFDQLLEPYKSLALLEFDLSLIDRLKGEELWAAEEAYLANPLNPQRWLPMTTAYQLSQNHRQRLASVRQNISGASSDTKEAYIRLLRPLASL